MLQKIPLHRISTSDLNNYYYKAIYKGLLSLDIYTFFLWDAQ